MDFFPSLPALSKGHVILIGAGAQAIAKLHLLRSLGVEVRWFSPQCHVAEEVLLAANNVGQIGITIGEPSSTDLKDALAVISAAGREIDERIAAEAARHRIPINIVD